MCSYWKVETASRHTRKKLFFCVHHLESFQLKLEPQSTQVGAKIMVSPHGGDDMLAQVWSWSEYLSTYFTVKFSHMKYLLSIICIKIFLRPFCIRNFCINTLQWSSFVCWAKVNFRVAHLDDYESTRALWLRCPYLEFTAQSSPSIPRLKFSLSPYPFWSSKCGPRWWT